MAEDSQKKTRWPGAVARVRSAARLTVLAGLVGSVAGLAALAFQFLSLLIVRYGLEAVAGYHPASPAGEASPLPDMASAADGFSPLLLLAVLCAGGLVSGALVFFLAPEAEGHGTDAAIHSFHSGRGLIRPRVPLVKLLASSVTIGSGGSGGREGPIAQIGAGFGSFLAVRLGLSESERRMLVISGMGAGVAAIFRAPLAGAIFAAEVLYRDEDIEAEALIPSFISCITSYCVYGLLVQNVFGLGRGFVHIFRIQPGLCFDNPLLLLPLLLLSAVLVGGAGLYTTTFYRTRDLFARLELPGHLKPALGALATGLVALGAYHLARPLGDGAQRTALSVLSSGYGVLQDSLTAPAPDVRFALVLLLVGVGKIVTTSLSIGSGGSGGVFGPSMVIGGSLGGAVGLLLHTWSPDLVPRTDVFVILGMAGFFTAAAKTPISTIVIVSEMTGGYELLLPAMWVAALCYLLSPRTLTIYRRQVPSRRESPAHAGDFVVDVLRGLTVQSAGLLGRTDFVTVPAGEALRKIVGNLPHTRQTVFPVVGPAGQFTGLFGLSDIRDLLFEHQAGTVIIAQDIVDTRTGPLAPDTGLPSAMRRFAGVSYEELPVVDPATHRVVAMLSRKDLLAVYQSRLPPPPPLTAPDDQPGR
jgi:CIC family chloride channel protein